MKIDKKMEWKMRNVTLPRIEDNLKSLNTQKDKEPLIKQLKDT